MRRAFAMLLTAVALGASVGCAGNGDREPAELGDAQAQTAVEAGGDSTAGQPAPESVAVATETVPAVAAADPAGLSPLEPGEPTPDTAEGSVVRTTLEEMIRTATFVFMGTVVAVGGSETVTPDTGGFGLTRHRIRLAIERVLREPPADMPDLADDRSMADVSLLDVGDDPFRVGGRFLVFAVRTELGELRLPALYPVGVEQGIYAVDAEGTASNSFNGSIPIDELEGRLAPAEPFTSLDCETTIAAEHPYPGGAGAPDVRNRMPDAWLTGLDNTDVVQPEGDDAFVAVRDGRRIAAIRLVPAADETWWIEAFVACEGDGIALEWPPPPTPADVPDAALVRCDGSLTEVVTPFVRPQRDGVHVRVEGVGDGDLAYGYMSADGGGGSGAGPGEHVDQVWEFGPGRVTVTCFDAASGADPSEVPHTAHLTIVDPDHLYVSTVLAGCPNDESFGMYADFAEGAAGTKGDPVDVARSAFARHGIREGDVVERAGYPEGAVRVRAQRDGRTVLVATLTGSAEQGWLIGEVRGCAGFEAG